MQTAAKQPPAKGSLELIEEATQLLRTAPASALACYYIGALPFVLALLYFWGDMSQSAFAGQHVVEAALGVAAVFVWMKFWQARFGWQLRGALTFTNKVGNNNAAAADARDVSGWRRSAANLVDQLAFQPIGLFVVAIALVLTLPFAWVYAFFQNLTVLPPPENRGSNISRAGHLAKLWPKQNHFVLLILSGFALFVFLNLVTVTLAMPHLVKMLFGIESLATRSGTSLLNSTFFAVMAALTYLCVDPLVKAVYTLRCFYGESLQTGEDLKAELRQAGAATTAAIAALIIVCVLGGADARAEERSGSRQLGPEPVTVAAEADSSSVSSPELDQAIRHTIQHRKYTWREPRDKVVEAGQAEEGLLSKFLDRVEKMVSKWAKGVGNWIDKLLRRLFGSRRAVTRSSTGYGWMMWSEALVYILIAAAIVGLGFLIYRIWRDRLQRSAVVASQPIQPPPDLTDLNFGPEHLPEDGWIQLARDLVARGEWRLALRAFYLASLAHLAGRHLISLAKFKSNREYERELRRRAHSVPELLACFGENVSVFDRVWYGQQPADPELVQQFAANVDRAKTVAGA